jgi:small subunit ribosomal protein S9
VSEEETPQEQAPREEVSQQSGAQEPVSAEEAAAAPAVPGDEAEQIAAVAEDAPLQAYEEAGGEAPHVPAEAIAAAEQSAPGTAVPSEEATEIAAVAEDAPLEAYEEAETVAAEAVEVEVDVVEVELEEDEEEPAPRVKPAVPGAHLEVDIVPEGVDPLGRDEPFDPYAIEDEETDAQEPVEEEEPLAQPISTAAIDLAAGARYRATGKRKTAVARVTLRPGSGEYKINGRTLDQHFTRDTLQRNIRQPLETVGYQDRMDVIALLHGGGISAQAGALRHGISRALLEADPNLRGELKRRGFLTRDSRAKERKKAGLKKARKRPQFSKR